MHRGDTVWSHYLEAAELTKKEFADKLLNFKKNETNGLMSEGSGSMYKWLFLQR